MTSKPDSDDKNFKLVGSRDSALKIFSSFRSRLMTPVPVCHPRRERLKKIINKAYGLFCRSSQAYNRLFKHKSLKYMLYLKLC
jgi:hypothetical protein